MSRPLISGSRVWCNHERRVLNVMHRALELLRKENSLDICEDSLNRRLVFCVRKANNEFFQVGEGFDWLPTYDSKNQPDSDDEEGADREQKRPDFQWGFVDHSEPDPVKQDKIFAIECKRLGNSEKPSWIFNRNYVENGIVRFIRKEHGYGKSAASGAMIGYIRNMICDDILGEVNGHGKIFSLGKIRLGPDGWVSKGVSRLEQKIDRPEVLPTPFNLRHLWVDIRASQQPPADQVA